MTRPKDALHIYGMHDWSQDWAALLKSAAKTGWCVITLEIGDDPNDRGGQDFSHIADQGITVIGRLNYSHHGQGTIPLPDRYDEFARRCANFVAASKGCWTWIIGNEPNLAGERPGAFIRPEDYARCFGLCKDAIKGVDSSMRCLVAPVAPYNVDSGSWIDYWFDMLSACQGHEPDGLTIHTYSRGGNPSSITSQDKMNPPYEKFYNGFLAYKDFLAWVPQYLRNLPVFITETDQNIPWVDTNSGWVRAAYSEIDSHNRGNGTQKILCLCLYRWSTDDKWQISPKRGVVDDFAKTVRETSFLVPAIAPPPVEPVKPAPGTAKVTAPAGANVRTGPGVGYPILKAVVNGTLLKVTGRNADSSWWKTDEGWVSATILSVAEGTNVPVEQVSAPTTPVPTPKTLGREWLIFAVSRILKIDPLVVKAILAIESGGRGFEGSRMIIRFENHILEDQLKRLAPSLQGWFNDHFAYGSPPWTGHKWRLNPGAPWIVQHTGLQSNEWDVFNYARSVHQEAAMRSISMGSAQIMGFHFKSVGYDNVADMFNDYNTLEIGEYNQLMGFFSYITNNPTLLEDVRNKNWNGIASAYNGTGGVATYAPAIRTKYLELGGKN